MKANKSVLRSHVTDEHLQATLWLISINEFQFNIEKLADAKHWQRSSQKN